MSGAVPLLYAVPALDNPLKYIRFKLVKKFGRLPSLPQESGKTANMVNMVVVRILKKVWCGTRHMQRATPAMTMLSPSSPPPSM